MVLNDETSEKFFGLSQLDMMTLDGPACDERFYLDSWKQTALSPASSPSASSSSGVASSEVVTPEGENMWRRSSSASESAAASYDHKSAGGSVWTQMSSANNSDFSQQGFGMCSYPSPSSDAGLTWKEKSVEQWTADDVTLWICSLMNNQSQQGYQQMVNVAPYLNLRGLDLLQMTSTDMQVLDRESGMFVFLSLQSHMTSNMSSPSPNPYSQSSPVHSPYSPHSHPNQMEAVGSPMDQSSNQQHIKEEPQANDMNIPSLDLNIVSFDPNNSFPDIKSIGILDSKPTQSQQQQQRSPLTPPHEQVPTQPTTTQHTPPVPPMNNFVAPNMFSQAPPAMIPAQGYPAMGQWAPSWAGSMGIMSPPGSVDGFYPPGAGGNHLWEFIRDLLFDSRYNPSLIKWEDREEGIFKFVKSDQVAKLWGKKKNNSAMTYEKLSRAMRYYYRRRILERIDGRRLVYKFGPMATGWKA